MEPCLLYVGSEDGVHVFEFDGVDLSETGWGVRDETVRAFSVHPDDPRDTFAAAGLRGWGLHRTRDAGETWETVGFTEEWVWDVHRDPPNPETICVGTEPPAIYRSADGGETFKSLDLTALPTEDWSFGRGPFHAGHVHGFSVDPTRPERIYAAVEHGAFVYSRDGGETWAANVPGADAHDTCVVPEHPDRVLLSTGGGLFLSRDAGETFESIPTLDGWYVKSLVPDHRTGRVYVDAARSHANTDAGIWWSESGVDWTRIEGVPPVGVTGCNLLVPHPDHEDVLFHATDDGEESRIVVRAEGEWHEVGPWLPKIRAVAAAPLP